MKQNDMKKKSILKITNVSFSYGEVPVLRDVNLDVKERDFLGIIGPNGGGKTTLLKLILGLLEPDSGKIELFGQTPQAGREFTGYVPQFLQFDRDFPITVLEVVLVSFWNVKKIGFRYSKSEKEKALAALRLVGMEQYARTQIGALSGGQIQRVFIARALALEPKLLILDEPLASIDPVWQTEFYKLLHSLNKETTIILVTHDVGVISTYVDQIACVNQTIHFHGSTDEGIHRIPGMYECPVDLVSHHALHRHEAHLPPTDKSD